MRPRSSRGYLPVLAGKQKRRGGLVVRAASCPDLFNRSLLRVNLQPRQELHEAGSAVNVKFRRGGGLQSNSIRRVNGLVPFRVPSQPGTAIEKRPAVPPATMIWISSTDGNFETGVSGVGALLENRRLLPSP